MDALPIDDAAFTVEQSSSTDPISPSPIAPPLGWILRHEFAAFWLLLLICSAVMLPNLSYPLIEPDESRYVQIAIEMLESGDWVTPTLASRPYLDKPPMLYWLTAASMSLFGRNETAARLPCVTSALLTILLIFWLGRKLIGSRAAWCGAISLLLCGGFVFAGRFIIMDSLLTLFTTTALLCGYLAIAQDRLRWNWWIAASVACGLGVLTKGPVSLVLCVPPILAVQWIGGERHRVRATGWIAFLFFAVLPSLPWFAAVAAVNDQFFSYFLWKHNLVRFTNGFIHQQPWWFFLPVLLAGMFPASLLVVALAMFLSSRDELLRKARRPEHGYLLVAAIWIVGFFSLSSCKLATYILPALPMLSLLLGSMFEHCVLNPQAANRVSVYLQPVPRRASGIVIVMCGLSAATEMAVINQVRWIPLAVLMICIVAAVMLAIAWKREIATSLTSWGFTTAISIASVTFVFSELLPMISELRSVHGNAALALEQDASLPVVYFDRESFAASFYIPKRNLHKFEQQELEQFTAFIAEHPRAIVVTSNDGLNAIEKIISSSSDLIPAGGLNHVHIVNRRATVDVRVASGPNPSAR